MKRCIFALLTLVTMLLGISGAGRAQIAGHHSPGSWGVKSGSQLAEGIAFAPIWIHYGSHRIMDADGNELKNLTGEKREIGVDAGGLLTWWVSKYKILGANYGAMANIPFADNQIEFASFNFESGFGMADIYVQPVNLGWHLERADFLASYGFYIPTGNYEAGAQDNNGMGMWTHEFGAGTTLYFDDEKRWHFAATGYFELNGTKKDSDIDVGNTLTLEGGLGRSFFEGALSVGVAYYANWKLSKDQIGLNTDIPNLPEEITLEDKHRVYAVGPDVTVPIAVKGRLISLITARYQWELDARNTLEGERLTMFVIFPFFAGGGSVK